MKHLSRRDVAKGALAIGLGALVPASSFGQDEKPKEAAPVDLEKDLSPNQKKLLEAARKGVDDSHKARLKSLLTDATEPCIVFSALGGASK